MTNIHPNPTTTPTSTTPTPTSTPTTPSSIPRTQLSSHQGRGNNMVLNNAALSLYTQLSSSVLLRYPHLFDEALWLFLEQKKMMSTTTLHTSTAFGSTQPSSPSSSSSSSSSSSMHGSGYITMLSCAGRAHRREVTEYILSYQHTLFILTHPCKYFHSYYIRLSIFTWIPPYTFIPQTLILTLFLSFLLGCQ